MSLSIRSFGPEVLQERHRHSVEVVLTQVRTTRTGRLVLQHIEMSSLPVRIVPFTATDARLMKRYPNAYARPMHFLSSGSLSRHHAAHGTGSEVHISPSTFVGSSLGAHPDRVLLHELCHALRHIYGLQRFHRNHRGRIRLAPFFDDYENMEEFFAVMVTSIHASENGELPRRGHRGDSQDGDIAYLREARYAQQLRQIMERMPHFTNELGRIDTGFNPFAPGFLP